MNKFMVLSFLVFVAFSTAVIAYSTDHWMTPTTVSSLGPTIEDVQELTELVAMKFTVSDVLAAEEDGYRGSWLVKGDVWLGINLMDAKVTNKDNETQTAELLLPPPHVTSARVDHHRTMTWDVKKGSWNPLEWDQSPLRDEAMKHAQRLVEHMGSSESQKEEAKRQAELIIENIYKMVGWDVTVRWQSRDYTAPPLSL